MNNASRLISYHEGICRHVYQDSRGYWTIGVGRNVHPRKGPGLRDSEIELMLSNDIAEYVSELTSSLSFFRNLSPCRQDVLLDMRHNLGSKGFFLFRRMLAALAAGDYKEAAKEILDSAAARAPERGLRSRYRVLAAMMSTDRYPSWLSLPSD